VLKALVEMCGWGSPVRDYGALFGLVSTAHLTYLLAKSGSGNEGGSASSAIVSELLTSPSLSSMLPNEASFVEELFLEISQRLNSLDFPIEVSNICYLMFPV
jgi:hypothetical protein